MKEKFLQFFTGKLSKSIYIAVASSVVCAAVVVGSVVAVHNHNQSIKAENTTAESVTETVTESTTEDISVTEGNDTTAPARPANNEPTGDPALQYLAEYNRITEEYEAKREELNAQIPTVVALPDFSKTHAKPMGSRLPEGASPEEQQKALAEDEQALAEWESESIRYEQQVQKNEEAEKLSKELQKQIDDLDAQYEKDIAALKTRYGIA